MRRERVLFNDFLISAATLAAAGALPRALRSEKPQTRLYGSGERPCGAGCGRTISANKEVCKACAERSKAAFGTCAACGGPMPETTDAYPCGYCPSCMATKSIDQLGRESIARRPA